MDPWAARRIPRECLRTLRPVWYSYVSRFGAAISILAGGSAGPVGRTARRPC